MTAAEYRALSGSKASKAPAAAPVARSAPRPPKSPPAPVASPTGQEIPRGEILALPKPTFGTLPGPCSWVVNGQCLSLAAPFDPDRHRITLTGPRRPSLLLALLAVVQEWEGA